MPATRSSVRDRHRRALLAGWALRVRQRFHKRLARVLPAPEFLRVPLPFLRPRAAAVTHLDRDAADSLREVPRGEAAAGAAEVQRVLQPDIRHLVAAEHTRTDTVGFSFRFFLLILASRAGFQASVLWCFAYSTLRENHSKVTHHRIPIPVCVTGSRITDDFATLNAELVHRGEHHDRRSQPAHGNFLLAADIE
jgi:hypothetical protein